MPTAVTVKPAAADPDKTTTGKQATVAVVIPTFNHAHFLADAIRSVLAQTRPADEIVVVDDGSADDPAAVVAQFHGVKLIRQDNRGLSGARNTGIRNCTTDYIVFLDADDRLLPTALETGLACMADRPDSAFVYGGHRFTGGDGRAISPDTFYPIAGNAHLALLSRGNSIVSIASVLFRRDFLLAENGFDHTLRRCEDYDLFLRLAYRHPIASHPAIVTEYRKHDENMSNNYAAQLETVLEVLDRHERRIAIDPEVRLALQDGRAHVHRVYVSWMVDAAFERWHSRRDTGALLRDLLDAARCSPMNAVRRSLGRIGRRVFKGLPYPIGRWVQWLRGQPDRIPVGSVRFGDFKRLSPISNSFGVDRGTSVDRYYIERFLARNANDVRGRVLELGDNSYTLRFGGARVERSDILHVDASNPRATFVGDLARPDVLPKESFDCIVFTQALQFIFDFKAALGTLHDALKPGGVLLMTTPGVSKMRDAPWTWYWNFTPASVSRLLQDLFGDGAVSVEAHGNVFAAVAFLHGVAVEELDVSRLDTEDLDYSVVVAARVVKRKDA